LGRFALLQPACQPADPPVEAEMLSLLLQVQYLSPDPNRLSSKDAATTGAIFDWYKNT
jgi:hypothetical protein